MKVKTSELAKALWKKDSLWNDAWDNKSAPSHAARVSSIFRGWFEGAEIPAIRVGASKYGIGIIDGRHRLIAYLERQDAEIEIIAEEGCEGWIEYYLKQYK
jgi:hypothetical protein